MPSASRNIMQLNPIRESVRLLSDPLFDEKQITFYVHFSDAGPVALRGNKWHKLKYNLLEADRLGLETLLTFGGAYSNHIAATACAAKLYGFKSIGIIRGEETLPLNKTLHEAKANGMSLYYESREQYRLKESESYVANLRVRFGDFYLVPEGGSNSLALPGCRELLDDITIPFDFVCSPCGTGTTLAGLVTGLKSHQQALGFSVLNGGSFLQDKIVELLAEKSLKPDCWQLIENYHFGGYAKTTAGLTAFIKDFEKKHAIVIEPIYTGKMFYGLYDLIRNDFFKPGTVLLAIHTGGLQYLPD